MNDSMKKPATLILLFFTSHLLFSQLTKKIDSLKELLIEQHVDSARFNTNILLWRFYLNLKTDSAIFYGSEALEIARDVGNKMYEGRALTSIGLAHSMRNEFPEATEYLVQAQQIFDESPNPTQQAAIFNEYGIMHLLQKQMRDAIPPFLKSIQFKEMTGDSIGIAKTLNNLGGVYEQLDMPDSSLYFHFKSMAIKQKMGYKDGVGHSKSNISSIYLKQGRYEESMQYARESLEIFEKSENRDGKIYALNMVAENYRVIGEHDQAIAIQERVLKEAKALSIFRRIETAHKKIASSYEAMGDFKSALENERLYRNYKDSVDNERNVRRIEQVKADYEIQKREVEIAKQEVELTQQATFRNALFGGIGLLLVIIGLIYRNQRIKAKSLNEKDALLREIHHRVKNNLQVISSLLNMQSYETDSPEMQEVIQEGQSRVKAMSLIHQKLYQTENIAEIDFQDYIQNLVDQLATVYKKNDLEITNEILASDVKLDIDTAIPLGLILNELISNAYKYAFSGSTSGKIKIDLKRLDGDQLQLEVADNGSGLSEDINFETVKSFGLKLVNILTKQLKGSLSYTVDNGTRFSITFSDSRMLA